jgi:hypothetical protein
LCERDILQFLKEHKMKRMINIFKLDILKFFLITSKLLYSFSSIIRFDLCLIQTIFLCVLKRNQTIEKKIKQSWEKKINPKLSKFATTKCNSLLKFEKKRTTRQRYFERKLKNDDWTSEKETYFSNSGSRPKQSSNCLPMV